MTYIKFTAPKLTIAEVDGEKYLFAAQSFIAQFPEVIDHVFEVPDRDYDGPHFEQYCKDRIKNYSDFDKKPDNGFKFEDTLPIDPEQHHPHEAEMWPDSPKGGHK